MMAGSCADPEEVPAEPTAAEDLQGQDPKADNVQAGQPAEHSDTGEEGDGAESEPERRVEDSHRLVRIVGVLEQGAMCSTTSWKCTSRGRMRSGGTT